MSAQPPPATRVLVVRVGAMGDVLHALPAMAALQEMRPHMALDWVVDPRWAPLLVNAEGSGPLVSRVHVAPTKAWSQSPLSSATAGSVLALRKAIAKESYTQVLDVQGTLRSAVLGRFAGAERFAGFADPREAAAAWFYQQRFRRRGAHVVEQVAALVGEAFGTELAPVKTPALPRDGAAEIWAEDLLQKTPKRLALLAPTAGWGAKQWPAERFGSLAGALRDRDFNVLVNAAHGADPIARRAVEASAGAAQVVSGGLAQLVALTRRAALVVGGDTGPVHLAAGLGIPVVGLYGPTDPARNGPWGAGPVRVLRHPDSETSYKRTGATEAGLSRISVDEVVAAAEALESDSLASRG